LFANFRLAFFKKLFYKKTGSLSKGEGKPEPIESGLAFFLEPLAKNLLQKGAVRHRPLK